MSLVNFLKSFIYASLAIVPAIAWYVSESSFFPFISGKGFAFRFIIDTVLVAWVALALLEPSFRPKRSAVFFSYSAFLITIFIANLVGENPYLSFFGNYERMEGWFTHLHLFLYFTVLYSVYKTNQDWSRMFGWFTVSAIAVVTEGIFQLFGRPEFFMTKFLGDGAVSVLKQAYPVHMGDALRLDSTLGNSIYFAIYTLMFFFISFLMAFKVNKWKGKQNHSALLLVAFSAAVVLMQNLLNYFATNAQASGAATSQLQTLVGVGYLFSFVGLAALIYTGKMLVNKIHDGEIGSWPFVVLAFINLVGILYTQTRGAYVGLVVGIVVSLVAIIFSVKGGSYKLIRKISTGLLVAMIVLITAFFAFKSSSFVQNSLILKRIATINTPNMSSVIEVAKNGNYEDMAKVFGETTIVSRVLNMKMSVDGVSESTKTMLLGFGQENYATVFSKHFDPRMYSQEVWFDRAHNVFMDWLVAGGVLGLVSYLALYFTPLYMMWLGKGRRNMDTLERAVLTGALSGYFIHNIFVFDNLVSYIVFIFLLAYIASITRSQDSNEDKNLKHFNPSSLTFKLGVAGASLFSLAMLLFLVVRPLMTNLEIIDGFRKFPTSYEGFSAATEASFAKFSSAVNRETFGRSEAVEQMLQKSLVLSQVDVSRLSATDTASAIEAVNKFRTFTEAKFEEYIKNYPSARNTSFYGQYLRQLNRNEEALRYSEMAYALSPEKQLIAYQYANTLAVMNRNEEAMSIIEKAYKSDISNKQAKEIYEAMMQAAASSTKGAKK